MNLNAWATASPRFIVPDNMLVDAIERAKRDVSTIKDMEWNLWNTGKVYFSLEGLKNKGALPFTGAALGFSINGFTTYKESHFILNFKGSLVKGLEIHGSPEEVLEIHGFTGTHGTRPIAISQPLY